VKWFNANTIALSFFSSSARLSQDQHTMTTGTSFLYKLIKSKVSRKGNNLDSYEDKDVTDLAALIDFEGNTLPYEAGNKKETHPERRAHLVGSICHGFFLLFAQSSSYFYLSQENRLCWQPV
jgi:hypothetical protein